MEKKFVYETKCRRCGGITEWTYTGLIEASVEQFNKAIEQSLIKPQKYACQYCAEGTVQDLMFHDSKNIRTDARRFSLVVD